MKKSVFLPVLLILLAILPAGAIFAYGPGGLVAVTPSLRALLGSGDGTTADQSVEARVGAPLSLETAADGAMDEEHSGTVGMPPDAYCRTVTRPRAQSHKASLAACIQSEEEARFELTAMCGTEELMAMWRQCASTNMSSVSQRSCMFEKLELTGSKHKTLVDAGLQLVAVAEYGNTTGLNITSRPGIALEKFGDSIIVVTGGDRVAYVGSSKQDLSSDLVRWRRTINTGLRGGRYISPEFNLDAWRDTIYENGSMNIYARPAIPTDSGPEQPPVAAQVSSLKDRFAPAISSFSE